MRALQRSGLTYNPIQGWRSILAELHATLRETHVQPVVARGHLLASDLRDLPPSDMRRIQAERLMDRAAETCDQCGARGNFMRLLVEPEIAGERRYGVRCQVHMDVSVQWLGSKFYDP